MVNSRTCCTRTPPSRSRCSKGSGSGSAHCSGRTRCREPATARDVTTAMSFRIVGAIAFAAAMVGLFPATAAASCAQTTVAQSSAQAEVVVYGTVTETRQTFAAAGGVIRFRAERYLKGTLAGEVEVYLGPSRGGAITSVDYQAV